MNGIPFHKNIQYSLMYKYPVFLYIQNEYILFPYIKNILYSFICKY